ncbi:MAG: AAA family ATPase [Phycisphaerales bacterium]|nr:AAA family ATPase [Phycisphaerales bacterium]
MNTTSTNAPSNEQIQEQAKPINALIEAVGTVVVGQEQMIRSLVIGLLTGGHVLLEGVPGLAKTLTVTTLADALHAKFARIQFTPDLLPADLIGTEIYNPKEATFTARKGPIFANIVLADEINRAPAKVQSALLEAMQEKHATIGGKTHPLVAPDEPFLVLATQNPIEQEGTYPLPEAQIDRFMFKIKVGYPSASDERLIVDRMISTIQTPTVQAMLTLAQLGSARKTVNEIYIDDKLKNYIVSLVQATRDPDSAGVQWSMEMEKMIEFGASPRASLALARAARASAFLEGRGFVTPSDIKMIGMDVMRHRVIISYEAEAEGITPEDLVQEVFDRIAIP